MNRSFSFAQPLTVANPSTAARIATPSSYLRALLLSSLAVIGSVGAAFAQDASAVKAKQVDAQSLYMTVDNPMLQRVQVQVVSLAKSTTIMNEVNHNASYGMQLHFKGLPAGPYAVLLRVGHERYRYNVQVADQTQTTISVSEEVHTKPLEVVSAR